MSTSTQTSDGKLPTQRAVEVAIRIGLVFLLAAWCFLIVEPFIIPILWGMIIAIASYPLYRWMQVKLGGRGKLAATVFTLVALALLITPTVMLMGTVADTTQALSQGTAGRQPDHPAAAGKRRGMAAHRRRGIGVLERRFRESRCHADYHCSAS